MRGLNEFLGKSKRGKVKKINLKNSKYGSQIMRGKIVKINIWEPGG